MCMCMYIHTYIELLFIDMDWASCSRLPTSYTQGRGLELGALPCLQAVDKLHTREGAGARRDSMSTGH